MLHLIALAAAAVSMGSAGGASASPPDLLGEVRWVATPSGADIAAVYPPTAVAAGKGGAVLLECHVATAGSLEACRVQIEDPVGLEFGEAALELAPLFRMAPTAPDGSATAGRSIRIPILFQIVSNGDRLRATPAQPWASRGLKGVHDRACACVDASGHTSRSPAPQSDAMVVNPDWLHRPTGEDMARVYPEAAQRKNMRGRAVLRAILTWALGTVRQA